MIQNIIPNEELQNGIEYLDKYQQEQEREHREMENTQAEILLDNSKTSKLNESLENRAQLINESSFTLSSNLKAKRDGSLIENFIVVGLPQDTVINEGDKVSYDSKILYQYPPSKECDPQIVNFCFPEGIKLIQVKRRRSFSDLNSVLFKSLSELESSSSSFMFLITGGEHLLYAVCVLNTELISELPSFFSSQNSTNHVSNSEESYSNGANPSQFSYFTPRCYCVISRFPYFKAHFDFLYSIIGKERLYRTNKLLQTLQNLQSDENDDDSKKINVSTMISSNNDNNHFENGQLNQSLLVAPRRPNKPLPPLPPQTLEKSSNNININNPNNNQQQEENFLFSPTETSPLFTNNPKINNNHSNNGHHSKGNFPNVHHSRSQSSPISNLKAIQEKFKAEKLIDMPTPPMAPLSNSSSSTMTSASIMDDIISFQDDEDIDIFPEYVISTTPNSISTIDLSTPNLFNTPSPIIPQPTQDTPNKTVTSPKPLPKLPEYSSFHTIENLNLSNKSINSNISNNSSNSSNRSNNLRNSLNRKQELEDKTQELQKLLLREEIESIEYYSKMIVPKVDEKLIINLPGDQSPTQYDSSDDLDLIEKWTLGGLMKTLSLATIMQTLSCILLEKFLLITSKNIGLISNTVFALLALLKPYVYQGAFIPILPYNTMDALYCPIPFVIGITKIPSGMEDALDNCYILDVDNNCIKRGVNCPPIPKLPNESRLEHVLKNYHSEIFKEKTRQYSMDYPFKLNTSDIKNIHSFSSEIEIYHHYIIESIAYLISWNEKFDFGNQKHLEQIYSIIFPSNLPFIKQFLSTQLFTSHTELLFDTKNQINDSKNIVINHYKINKL